MKIFWKVLDIDSNLKLILRPRNKEAKESFLRLFPEMHEYLEAGGIVFEETDFTTQELLAFGDILFPRTLQVVFLRQFISIISIFSLSI